METLSSGPNLHSDSYRKSPISGCWEQTSKELMQSHPALKAMWSHVAWLVLKHGCNINFFLWNKIKLNSTENWGELSIKWSFFISWNIRFHITIRVHLPLAHILVSPKATVYIQIPTKVKHREKVAWRPRGGPRTSGKPLNTVNHKELFL